MEIAFGDKALRHICEDMPAAKHAFGETASAKLRHRVADMRAAETIMDLIAGNPRQFQGRHDQLAITIDGAIIMVFCSNHNVTPLLASGSVDWKEVTRIKILRIGQEDV